MPEQFDPRWEYFVSSEEFAEAFESGWGETIFDTGDFRLNPFNGSSKEDNRGIRFGKGDPNALPHVRFGRPKKDRREANLHFIVCKGCCRRFMQRVVGQKFCSRSCSLRDTATIRRIRPWESFCCRCMAVFEPKRTDTTRYCSRKCAGLAGAAVTRLKRCGDGCLVCGGEVSPSKSNNGFKKVYCSRRCGCIARDRRWRERTANGS